MQAACPLPKKIFPCSINGRFIDSVSVNEHVRHRQRCAFSAMEIVCSPHPILSAFLYFFLPALLAAFFPLPDCYFYMRENRIRGSGFVCCPPESPKRAVVATSCLSGVKRTFLRNPCDVSLRRNRSVPTVLGADRGGEHDSAGFGFSFLEVFL